MQEYWGSGYSGGGGGGGGGSSKVIINTIPALTAGELLSFVPGTNSFVWLRLTWLFLRHVMTLLALLLLMLLPGAAL